MFQVLSGIYLGSGLVRIIFFVFFLKLQFFFKQTVKGTGTGLRLTDGETVDLNNRLGLSITYMEK